MVLTLLGLACNTKITYFQINEIKKDAKIAAKNTMTTYPSSRE
jgi:hypothetical protein